MDYYYLVIIGILLPFILVFTSAYIPVVLSLCFYAFKYAWFLVPVTVLASGILWFKKKKDVSMIITVLVIDILLAGFIIYELALWLVSEVP